MKKKKILLKNIALLALIVAVFAACEKDFSSLDSDVVNSENTTHFNGERAIYPIVTFNKRITPYQSNRLPAHLIGYYNDPVNGGFSANFVTQVTPRVFSPDFGTSELDSVILTVPYYSRIIEGDGSNGFIYELDSIYGETPIKLSVYENRFFLRDFDPEADFSASQSYFSNGNLSSTNTISQTELENELLYESTSFLPSEEQIVLIGLNTENEMDSTKLSPRMRLRLDGPDVREGFWENRFLNRSDDAELSNLNNFLNHFRGLYFKSESIGGSGSMALLNFSSDEATVTIYYTKERDRSDEDGDGVPDYADVDSDGDGTNDNGTDTDGDQISDEFDVDITEGDDENGNGIDDLLDSTREEFVMAFTGNLVNIMENNFTPFPTGDEVDGDEKLYLKGGEGNMAVIDLFNGVVENDNGVNEDALDNFYNNFRTIDENGNITAKRLINEAFIEFYVDETMALNDEPERVYIYDLNNNTPLIDYIIDQSVSAQSLSAKIDHLVPLVREDDEDPESPGVKYKIRITEHLTNIFLRDSTNVKLGLVVMPGVNSIDMHPFLDTDDDILTQIPSGTLLSPQGTVLHGNNSLDQVKKAKLTIYYTEPEN